MYSNKATILYIFYTAMSFFYNYLRVENAKIPLNIKDKMKCLNLELICQILNYKNL